METKHDCLSGHDGLPYSNAPRQYTADKTRVDNMKKQQLEDKKNIDNKNTKKILSIFEILIDTRHESSGCFQFYGFSPLIFCFRWLIIPQNNQICMLLMFSFGNKNQQITENSYLVLINQKPCIQFTSYFSSRCNKLWGWFFYHQHAC